MNSGLVRSLLESLIKALPQDAVKKGIDSFLDKVEDAISNSKTKWDDAFILPIIAMLRRQLSITEEEGSPYADKSVATVNVDVTVKDETK